MGIKTKKKSFFGMAVRLTDIKSFFNLLTLQEKNKTATNKLQAGQSMINCDGENGSRRKELRGRQEAFPLCRYFGFHFSRLHENT